MAQIKKGVDLASFQIRRTKEILAMLMIQVTLIPDDATKIFVQVIKKAGLIVALYVSVHIIRVKGIIIRHDILF